MNNQEMMNRMKLMNENWAKSGIPTNAGRIGSGAAGGLSDRFAHVRNGSMRDQFAKFTNFDTNARQASNQHGIPQVKGAASFVPLPEPKVGKDRRPVDQKHKVEVAKFDTPRMGAESGELGAIASLFGGSGGRTLDSYGGGAGMHQPMGGAPNQMQYNPNDLNLDQVYAQKGGDYFDPRQMILQRQQQQPQQQQLAGYDAFQQQQVMQQPQGYNPNMPMDMQMQMMQAQYGNQMPQQHQPSEYMQYSQVANQMSPQEQMAEISRQMAMEVLSEYKKSEKERQILIPVRHKKHNNLAKDHNNNYYLVETDQDGLLFLKPVKMTSKKKR